MIFPSGRYSIGVEVTNTGQYDGTETVHWYVSDPYCSITRPLKELKYFEKQLIKAGETRKFHFHIDPLRDLGYVDGSGKRFVESGEYVISVGKEQIKIEVK